MNWLNYFQLNRVHRSEVPWERGIHPEKHLRKPLLDSLRRFQVGETGEGNHLKASAARRSAEYAETIALFIDEEKEHARMLALLIKGMGGDLMRWHWSDLAFIFIRRLMGLRLELMILLIAEMIAKRYYRALDEGTQDAVLKAVFGQIRQDEEGHIAFHVDTLHRDFGGYPFLVRLALRTFWQVCFWIVCALVILDHRKVLRAVKVRPGDFWADCTRIFDDVAWHVFRPARTLQPVRLPTGSASQ